MLGRAEVGTSRRAGVKGPAAADILYETESDGSRVESEAFKRYRQYRDAWIVAREDMPRIS